MHLRKQARRDHQHDAGDLGVSGFGLDAFGEQAREFLGGLLFQKMPGCQRVLDALSTDDASGRIGAKIAFVTRGIGIGDRGELLQRCVGTRHREDFRAGRIGDDDTNGRHDELRF